MDIYYSDMNNKHLDKKKLDDAPAGYIISTAVKSGKNFVLNSSQISKLRGNKILEEICLDILEDYEKQKGSRHEKGTVGGTKNVDNEKLFMVRVFVK